MENNKAKTTEHYIAYLDLLGVKKDILSDVEDFSLNNIRNIYLSWISINEATDYFDKPKIKIFSDNVIIAIEVNQKESLNGLIEFVAYLSEHFLECGYKVRGGITRGLLFFDDIMVWGKGLLCAYKLESEEAIYPRIILSNDIIEEISDIIRNHMIVQDNDIYYLNYLKGYGTTDKQQLHKIEKALIGLEKELTEEENIVEKLKWFKEYLLQNKKYYEERIEKNSNHTNKQPEGEKCQP